MTTGSLTSRCIEGTTGRARVRSVGNAHVPGLLMLVILLAAAPSSHGAVYQVTKTQDTNDGVCDADCSLREAILAAAANSGSDDIQLGPGTFTLTIPGAGENGGATGDLDITGASVSITGQGPLATIIDATGLGDRVVDVRPSSTATVVLEALTITGGACSQDGGGVYHVSGHLVLDDVVVRGNQAAVSGGGIYSYTADLTVQGGSVIRDNQCSPDWYGGGIKADAVTITDSTVAGNLGGSGGGVSCRFGHVNITGSTIAFNQAGNFDGGGIYAEGAVVALSNSTLFANYSGRRAGAIYVSDSTGSVTLDAVTLSGNSSLFDDSIVAYSSADVVFANTLIQDNCVSITGGVFASSGGNLESPGNTCGLDGPGDDVGVADPMLAPLGPYGGPTWTQLPLAGSPAIGSALQAQCLVVDQRGEPRADGACDVGAVERQPDEQDPIFVDGLESSDTGAWSFTSP